MSVQPHIVTFSAVDRIFDHATATQCARAGQALARLREAEVTVVLCSGRTRAEQEHLQQRLGVRIPFTSERGAAAFLPREQFRLPVPKSHVQGEYVVAEFGQSHRDVLVTLRRAVTVSGIGVRLLSEMSVEETARESGLSLLDARLAKLREYSELVWPADAATSVRTSFARALQAGWLKMEPAEYGWHVGAMISGSMAIGLIREAIRREHGRLLTIGLADEAAGRDLLPLVERPVRVQGPGPGGTHGWDASPGLPLRDVIDWVDAIADLTDTLTRDSVSGRTRLSRSSVV